MVKKFGAAPRLLVRDAGMEMPIGCKPKEKINRGNNQLKFAATRAFCAEREWSFRVVTKNIKWGYHHGSVKQLTRYYAPRCSATSRAVCQTTTSYLTRRL